MTLSALGILSAAGAGVVSAGSYELIATASISGSSSSVVFSSLGTYAADYKHLQIRYALRTTRSATTDSFVFKFNSDTANYTNHYLFGNGSSVASAGGGAQPHIYIDEVPSANFTANAFSAGVIDILDAYSTSKNKVMRVLNGRTGTNNSVFLGSGMYYGNQNAVSELTISSANTGNISSSSRVSIYGIKG